MDTIRLSLEMMYIYLCLPGRENAFFLLRVMNGISTTAVSTSHYAMWFQLHNLLYSFV
jgi:hypothetical protein